MTFEKTIRFRDADKILVFSGNTRPIWKRFFAFFNSSVGPLGSGHIKMSIIFNPGALKVTKSEFFDEKCVSFFVTLWSDGRRAGGSLGVI